VTQLINRNNTKSHCAVSKSTDSRHKRKREYNGIIAAQCKQRVALCDIGLVKDHGGHLVPFWVSAFFFLRSVFFIDLAV